MHSTVEDMKGQFFLLDLSRLYRRLFKTSLVPARILYRYFFKKKRVIFYLTTQARFVDMTALPSIFLTLLRGSRNFTVTSCQ